MRFLSEKDPISAIINPPLAKGGLIIADIGSFSERNLKKAGYKDNPIEGDTIEGFRLITADITKNTLEAVQEFGLSQKEAVRCKNMYALGLVYWPVN